MVYLDFSKAFDKVGHGILLHKLEALGITGNLGIHYITFSSKESYCLSNVYKNPELNIINPSSEVLNLGVYMSSNCTFDLHVSCVYKRCSNLSGWILRTFSTRETKTMMTLFKSLVLSRLDYASQL